MATDSFLSIMSRLESLFLTSYTSQENLRKVAKNEPQWLQQRREEAWKNFAELPIDQDNLFYKYTNFKQFNPNELVPYWEDKEIIGIDPQTLKIGDFSPNAFETHSATTFELSNELLNKGVFLGTLRELIEHNEELAKKIVKRIKQEKMKVQAAIQGEQVRVTSKKRDDLQAAMALVRAMDADRPLHFTNFRD